MKTLSVGTNRLLKKIDVRNCPNLTEPLALSGCPNIEEIYATGSGITGVELPLSGYLKVVHLPRVSNLTLRNQLYINDLRLEGYENIASLNIENCPTIDEQAILQQCTNIKRVRLTDVDWSFDDVSFLMGLVNSGIKGIDENGLNVDIPQISGTCHIKELTSQEMATIKSYFPYLTITYETLIKYTVRFLNGTTVLQTSEYDYGEMPVYSGETPTTSEEDYAFDGWMPEISAVTGHIDYVATFKFIGSYFRKLMEGTLATVSSDATSVTNSAFCYDSNVVTVDLPNATRIGANAFQNCLSLETLILRSSTMCTLANDNAFTSTPIASGTGYIYVPSALKDQYTSAWATYANQIRAIEDYQEIVGGGN